MAGSPPLEGWSSPSWDRGTENTYTYNKNTTYIKNENSNISYLMMT